jgi:hypothetical protein
MVVGFTTTCVSSNPVHGEVSIAINLKYDISVGDTDKSDVTVTFNIKEDLSIKLPLKDNIRN